MKTFILSILIVCIVFATGCSKKNNPSPKIMGNYSGRIVSGNTSTPVSVQLTDKTYKASIIGSQFNIGNGNYIVSNSHITFTDTVAHTDLLSSVAYLNGTYGLTLKEDSLIFGNDNEYSYRLKKQ